jgi:hypothetical protein
MKNIGGISIIAKPIFSYEGVEWLKLENGTYMRFSSVEHAKYILRKSKKYINCSDEKLDSNFEFVEVYDYENQY